MTSKNAVPNSYGIINSLPSIILSHLSFNYNYIKIGVQIYYCITVVMPLKILSRYRQQQKIRLTLSQWHTSHCIPCGFMRMSIIPLQFNATLYHSLRSLKSAGFWTVHMYPIQLVPVQSPWNLWWIKLRFPGTHLFPCSSLHLYSVGFFIKFTTKIPRGNTRPVKCRVTEESCS